MAEIPKTTGSAIAEALSARRQNTKLRLDDLKANVQSLLERTKEFAARTHAGAAMVFGAAVEERLERAILTKMRGISNNHKTRIFKNYGPLSSFSAKIDVSYIITTDIWNDLKVIKEIRNEFAHSTRFIDFNSPNVLILMKKFPTFDPVKSDAERFFFQQTNDIINYLVLVVNRTAERAP